MIALTNLLSNILNTAVPHDDTANNDSTLKSSNVLPIPTVHLTEIYCTSDVKMKQVFGECLSGNKTFNSCGASMM